MHLHDLFDFESSHSGVVGRSRANQYRRMGLDGRDSERVLVGSCPAAKNQLNKSMKLHSYHIQS